MGPSAPKAGPAGTLQAWRGSTIAASRSACLSTLFENGFLIATARLDVHPTRSILLSVFARNNSTYSFSSLVPATYIFPVLVTAGIACMLHTEATMSSLLKIRSARANGALSRGPVTPEGLARSSQNALEHGLTSRGIVLSNESQSELQQLREAYLLRFNPQTGIETGLVEQLAAARWRMERTWAIETALFDLEMAKQQDNAGNEFDAIDAETRIALAFRSLCDESPTLATLCRYEARYRRASERILESLRGLQGTGRRENGKLQNEPNYP